MNFRQLPPKQKDQKDSQAQNSILERGRMEHGGAGVTADLSPTSSPFSGSTISQTSYLGNIPRKSPVSRLYLCRNFSSDKLEVNVNLYGLTNGDDGNSVTIEIAVILRLMLRDKNIKMCTNCWGPKKMTCIEILAKCFILEVSGRCMSQICNMMQASSSISYRKAEMRIVSRQ